MKSTLCFCSALLLGTALAAPASIESRSSKALKPMSDMDILHYAMTLENLENAFYRDVVANYSQHDFTNDAFADPFYEDLKAIAAEESAHVKALGATLKAMGAPVPQECTYNWGPIEGAHDVVTLANIIEGLGVSAYLGVARNITNPDVLTSAGTIMTDEARHSGYMRKAVETSPFPGSSDVPLYPNEIHTMAHVFLASCPASNPVFPIKAFPALSVSSSECKAGSKITLSTPGGKVSSKSVKAAFVSAKGPVWFTVTQKNGKWTGTVPKGVTGQSYVLLNKGSSHVSDDTILAGPTWVEVS